MSIGLLVSHFCFGTAKSRRTQRFFLLDRIDGILQDVLFFNIGVGPCYPVEILRPLQKSHFGYWVDGF